MKVFERFRPFGAISILMAILMAGCPGGGSGVTPDTTAPTVMSTAAASGATGVAVNSPVTATFSEAMASATITTATFTLKQGVTPVSGAVSYVGTTATFTPATNLAPGTAYTATITVGATDLAGNALVGSVVPNPWTFTTGASADTTPPDVSFTDPFNLATGVPLNRKVAATFSEAMTSATITAATFTLKQGATPVSGAVSYLGTTATFTPAASLSPSTTYTATVTTGAKDLAGNALASNYVWSFTTSAAADTTPPTVSSTNPANLAASVAINVRPTATFSEAMASATITPATFTLKQGATPVSGSVAYVGTTATFTPAANLAASTPYTATVTTGAKDLAGNALASNYVWSFTTGAAADTTPPTVSSTNPANLATGVAINVSPTATFSEAMTSATITTATFNLKQGATLVSSTVSYVGITATLTPVASLASNTQYTATVTTGAKDLAGNALASNKVWTFTTGAAADTTPPTVSSTSPANLATNVTINTRPAASFSEAMAPLTITTATFTLKQGATPVSGTVNYIGTTATFTPASNLSSSTTYTATITTGAKDLAGNALASNYVWTFTTGIAIAAGPAPVVLGTAGNFVILAKSGIDTVPSSIVTGNLGVSPIARVGLTGWSESMDPSNVFSTSAQVTGKLYAADYAVPTPSNLTTAVSNMETAYTDAAGRSTPDFTELGAGEIGGLILVPGLYKWGTGISISTNVTLNGGPNDVWIFQIAGGITQANGTSVILTGGALPKNIFWQSFGVVAIGTTAHFEGVILAQTAITLDTGATINGRLLAQTAVTLKSSTVTQPAP